MASILPYGVGDASWRHGQTLVRRLFKPQTLDWETAVWEMAQLVLNPKKMYKSQYYKLMGKLRDDPSFYILETLCLVVLAVAWGLVFLPHWWLVIKLVVYMVLIDFFAIGAVVALGFWLVVNRLLQGYSTVDWGYCWDVHCNAFIMIWCLNYVVQLVLLPIFSFSTVLAVLIGNTLYLGAVAYYFIISFYGYNALPFATAATTLQNPVKRIQTVVVAGVLPALAVVWVVTLCLGINLSRITINWYFS